ncbi:MAG TPA: hypothetical protein VH598_10585, partial [Verrucomicrobiae bacterium]|nr:hypothetical protein [Verrucomicrobiae bacterium]
HKHETEAGVTSVTKEETDWKQVKTALDAVSGQCDSHASCLYWYTDFEKAKAAAKASGKPILSLRLLGKLDEEYSCANSRFFRTTLYANAEVSKYLRDHFILHWQSVRPVPRITIDFGDGRRIERTITGNSVHYVLDSNGEPVDALPGLYGPKAFLNALAEAEAAALRCAGLAGDEKAEYLRQYHRACQTAISKEWNEDLARIGDGKVSFVKNDVVAWKDATPTAQMAGKVAISKSAVESPMLKSLKPKGGAKGQPGRADLDDETWAKIAALHAAEAKLDAAAEALILSKNPTAFQASQVATAKRQVESPYLNTLRNLQRSIAEDTVRNEFLLHSQIHEWFAQGAAPGDLRRLNTKIYAELFLTPESDPWLGLAPADTFTGLENNGLVQAGR